jgi:hypothetical protein
VKMSAAKRNTIARLRKALRPLLYPTGIVDDAEVDGKMRLYLFQHGPGGNRDWCGEYHPFNRPGNGVRRAIRDHYRGGRWAGTEIGDFHGFYDNGIVDDICVGITTYPFSGLSLRTLRDMEKLVAKIARCKTPAPSR